MKCLRLTGTQLQKVVANDQRFFWNVVVPDHFSGFPATALAAPRALEQSGAISGYHAHLAAALGLAFEAL
jgi:hypothetical protein